MMNDHWDVEFSVLSSYRGINVNMHAVEALTTAFDLTKDSKYLDAAISSTYIFLSLLDEHCTLLSKFDLPLHPALTPH